MPIHPTGSGGGDILEELLGEFGGICIGERISSTSDALCYHMLLRA